MNMKLFCNHGGIYRFEKKLKKYSGEINPLEVHRNKRVYPWIKSWRTREVINSMFVYHFVNPDLRIEKFFKKDKAPENGGVDVEIGDMYNCTEGWRKFHVEPFCSLIVFWWKKNLLKALLTSTFIPPLLSSESRKKYTPRVLLMCLEALEEKFFLFSRERLDGG